MAFTDPILAGEELVRSAIRSQNYVPGVDGWRVAADGSAEFNSMSVRGDISATDVILNGTSLNATLAKKSQGVVAWVTGYPVVSTTTEAQIGFLELDVVQGRMYEVFATNITADITNANACELRVRYTTSTASFPDNTSPILVLSLRFSQFNLANVRHVYTSGHTGRLRLRLAISSLDGISVRSWAPGAGMTFGVIDQGVPPAAAGIIGNAPPGGVTLKDVTITTNDCNGYQGNGAFLVDELLTQGVNALGIGSEGYGNTRGWLTFSAGDLALLLDNLIGVTLANIVTCELFLFYESWYNSSGGIATVGYHNKSSLGTGSEPSGGVPNALQMGYTARNQGRWIDLKGNTSIMDAIRSGYLRGFMVGNGPTGTNYAGYAQATPDPNPPRLHVKYYG